MIPVRLVDTLQKVGGYATLLYVLGFLVVRARLVALGVWAAIPVIDAVYLYEGGLLVIAWAHLLLTKIVPVLAGSAALAWGVARLTRTFRERHPYLSCTATRVAQIGGLLVLYGFVLYATQDLMNVRDLMLTGAAEPPDRLSDPALLMVTVLLGALYFWMRKTAITSAVFPVAAAILAGAMLFIYLPIAHAVNQRCSEFPSGEVVLDAADSSPIPAMLVLLSDERLVFYETSSAQPVLRTVPEESVKSIRISKFVRLNEKGEY